MNLSSGPFRRRFPLRRDDLLDWVLCAVAVLCGVWGFMLYYDLLTAAF